MKELTYMDLLDKYDKYLEEIGKKDLVKTNALEYMKGIEVFYKTIKDEYICKAMEEDLEITK